ncbi:hypothetical protein [Bremerella sp. P1]|uniref:hypothetical protein n=1 Tax=Bremerella sp. P1 TaxID=3026424 RepID=UPI0023675587|nr:hypothetical protein [Bremerella sp. P1]WDI43193.1 hypothetical protein PSR63_04440 [Bremerella sp. P1]
MLFRLIVLIAKGYAFLLSLAAGGLIFANLFGVIVALVQVGGASLFGSERAPDPAVGTTWIRAGWCIGVLVAAIGDAVAFWKYRQQKSIQKEKPQSESHDPKPELEESKNPGRRHGFLASTAYGGLFGAFLGGMLGGTFILIWFSLTYSPFAPQSWVNSVSVERERTTSAREEHVTTTDHPVALLAFACPLALGAVTGAVMGAVYGVYDGE